MLHNEVTTESILGFISCQAEPVNLRDYPTLNFWSSDRRTREIINLAFNLAELNECPIKYIDGHFYIKFVGSGMWLMTEEELHKFLDDCAIGFGIPRGNNYDFSCFLN
jgi:hypothetical protein